MGAGLVRLNGAGVDDRAASGEVLEGHCSEHGMAFASLYEWWRNQDIAHDDDPGTWLATCTMITTEATDLAGRLRPRMPLTIAAADYDAWLLPEHQDVDELRAS